jgi:chromate transporter
MSVSILVALAIIFAELSLLAFGGANAVVSEMQRRVVDIQHWMSATDFIALYALAQTAPGPNLMIATLIGWRVASLPGAIVAQVALILPSSLLTAATVTIWGRFRDAPWRRFVQAGIGPVTVGLIAAGAALIARTAATDWILVAIAAVVTVLHLRTRLHPLWLFAVGALYGLSGLV